MTPTQRSLKQLRQDGWHVEVVEHYNSFTRRRHDLFGFADLLAIHPDHLRPLLVQVTARGVSARVNKIRLSPLLQSVRQHFDIEVHGWRRPLKNGKPHGKYVQRVVSIT